MARAADAGDRDGALLDAVDAFLEREVRPFARSLDHADTWPAQIVEKMRAMGLFGCIVEERYGGLGLSAGTYARVIERISAVWMSLAGIINSHLIMAALVQRAGWKTVSVPVNHRPRASGVSKYNNLGRALVGIRDLRGVAWLIARSRRTAVEER